MMEKLIRNENEAIEAIKANMPTSGYQMLRESLDMAIKALEEIQQYREIGTVEEIKDLLVTISEASEDVDESGISVGLIKDLIRLGKYREIGTVEDCREAMEKQKGKYIKIESYCPAYCPTCRFELSESLGDGYYEYFVNLSRCPKCGQKICWDENLEGMGDE